MNAAVKVCFFTLLLAASLPVHGGDIRGSSDEGKVTPLSIKNTDNMPEARTGRNSLARDSVLKGERGKGTDRKVASAKKKKKSRSVATGKKGKKPVKKPEVLKKNHKGDGVSAGRSTLPADDIRSREAVKKQGAEQNIADLIQGSYSVRIYGKKMRRPAGASGDEGPGYSFVFKSDGTGTVVMDDPAKKGRPFRWRYEGNAVILEVLDSRGYAVNTLRFPVIISRDSVIFEKSDVRYGDVNATRWEIRKSQ